MHRHLVYLREPLNSVSRAEPGTKSALNSRADVPAPDTAIDTQSNAIEGLHRAFEEFGAALKSQRSAIAVEIAQTSVELAVHIAERLLGVEIAANRQRLDQVVLSSLERIQASRAIAIKANPLDLDLLQQQLVENVLPDRFSELLNFQRDDSCPRGRLKLETDELFIEWDTQRSLSEIRGAMLDEIYTENPAP